MEILLLGPLVANAKHGAEVGIYDACKKLGHNVKCWDYRANVLVLDQTIRPFVGQEIISADLVLCPGAGVTNQVLESITWKASRAFKVLWNSEPIRLENYKGRIKEQKGKYNYYFTFDESEIPLYNDLGIHAVSFLPQAFNPNWYFEMPLNEIKDICFVASFGGKWLNRQILAERVAKKYNISCITAFDAKYVNHVYAEHKLVLNLGLWTSQSGPPEDFKAFSLQQRIFEAIGSCKVVITGEIPSDTNKLFTNKHDILLYNKDNLEEVIEYGLNDENRRRIQDNIRAIRANHTYEKRIERLIDIIG